MLWSCSHQWRVVGRTRTKPISVKSFEVSGLSMEAFNQMMHGSVRYLLACDICGKTMVRTLVGEESELMGPIE